MKVCRCFQATNEVEHLATKYRSAWDSIHQFERLLRADLISGHPRYPGLRLQRDGQPASIWKSRVICKELGGKSSGRRYVYERVVIDGDDYAICLTVYVHQTGQKEHQIIERMRDRSASFEATSEGLKGLDRSQSR